MDTKPLQKPALDPLSLTPRTGELTLRTEAGDQLLCAGMCAGFPAGKADGHHLLNLGNQPVVYLEISNRDPANDSCSYPDVDLQYTPGAAPGLLFTHKNGSPYG